MDSSPEILVVAGEASGDAHAAGLVRALRALRPDLSFFGMGGAQLAAAGVERLYDAREISVMGITEVLPKLFRILGVMRGLARAAAARRPALAILVDIPDFNLRLARRLKALGIPIAWYISPMVWAWRPGRVKQIACDVDRMLCILPFEEPWYRARGVPASFVGSPVLEQVPAPAEPAHFRRALGLDEARPVLAVLPGSRASELRRLGPELARAAARIAAERPGLQVVVPVAPGVDRDALAQWFEAAGVHPVLVDGRAPEVVGASDVAVVASGTATLEAGLMLRPLVVVYRVSALSGLVGRLLLKVKHVSLVNLLAGRALVPELLQREVRAERIAAEVARLWSGPARDEVVAGLVRLREVLGESGASARAAAAVRELLDSGAAVSRKALPGVAASAMSRGP
ncbi:MAG: lipid-A-disaccharide synthase [Myxococcaceae bacterium]|nr:lipid-A-disaccharide synthase [Myxococcaceae bacterium]